MAQRVGFRTQLGSTAAFQTTVHRQTVPRISASVKAELAEQDDGNVTHVYSPDEMTSALAAAGDKLVVLDISTKTCGPCKMIYPHFVRMSKEMDDVVFLKIYGDHSNDTRALMKSWGVRAVPSFYFFRNSEKFDDMSGSNPPILEEKLMSLRSVGPKVEEEVVVQEEAST